MTYIYVVSIVDLADFDKLKATRAFAEPLAAMEWGEAQCAYYAERAREDGETDLAFINCFKADIQTVEYVA